MLNTQILCSSGAFTYYTPETDHRSILHYGPLLAAAAIDIEVMFHRTWYDFLPLVAADLRRSGLHMPVLHADKKIGRGLGKDDPALQAEAAHRFERNCWLAQQIGASVIVLHCWERPESDSHLEINVRLLPHLIDVAAAYGLVLAAETIPCSVRDPLSNVLQILNRDPRCRIALDTEFLAMAGQLDLVFCCWQLWEQQRVCHIHIKDWTCTGERYLQPGQGEVDFAAFFAGLHRHAYTGALSLEASGLHEDGSVDMGALCAGAAFIRQMVSKQSATLF